MVPSGTGVRVGMEQEDWILQLSHSNPMLGTGQREGPDMALELILCVDDARDLTKASYMLGKHDTG